MIEILSDQFLTKITEEVTSVSLWMKLLMCPKVHISKEDRGQTAPFSTKNQNQLKQYGLKHFLGAFIIFWNPSQEYEAH